MLWGVGTGRCGTKSLAKMLGGVHEPRPWIEELVWIYRFTPRGNFIPQFKRTYDQFLIALRNRLFDRSRMDFPVIVDSCHSWVMPVILEIDENARFAWIERDFNEVCESFLRGGAFTETDQFGKYRACPDHVAHSHPREVCVAAHVSQILDWIRESFDPKRDIKYRCPEDLTEWENRWPEKRRYEHWKGTKL